MSTTANAKFEGTDRYVATPDLMLAVNAALTLGRPLLVKGEPGTGKTLLAARLDSLHDAHHAVMDCLGSMLWESQRSGRPPDGQAYIDCVQRKATRGPAT